MELTALGLDNDLICLEPLDERFREHLRASDAVNSIWLSLPAIQRGAGFDAYYDHVLKRGDMGELNGFALLDPNDDKRFVGVTALVYPNKMHRRLRIGYTWLEPHLRGRGIYAATQKLLIQRALDHGVNLLDTAYAYGNEAVVGKAIQGRDRDRRDMQVHLSRFNFREVEHFIDQAQ